MNHMYFTLQSAPSARLSLLFEVTVCQSDGANLYGHQPDTLKQTFNQI
ncbi:hypothetical protein [Bacillus sp. HU-1818]|nr:hypothetical protein [Bacillus sp. HU-1818]